MDDKLILSAVAADLSQSVNRRLLLWAVRWTIGFGIITVVVRFWPTMSWLWWAGIAVAALSLAVTLIMHFVLRRKIAVAQAKMAEAERLIAEHETLGDGEEA